MTISVEYKKVCPICGEEFTTSYSKAVYCSKNCAAISANRKDYQRELERKRLNPEYKSERDRKNSEYAKAKYRKAKMDEAIAMAIDVHKKASTMNRQNFVEFIVANVKPKKGGIYHAGTVRVSEE